MGRSAQLEDDLDLILGMARPVPAKPKVALKESRGRRMPQPVVEEDDPQIDITVEEEDVPMRAAGRPVTPNLPGLSDGSDAFALPDGLGIQAPPDEDVQRVMESRVSLDVPRPQAEVPQDPITESRANVVAKAVAVLDQLLPALTELRGTLRVIQAELSVRR